MNVPKWIFIVSVVWQIQQVHGQTVKMPYHSISAGAAIAYHQGASQPTHVASIGQPIAQLPNAGGLAAINVMFTKDISPPIIKPHIKPDSIIAKSNVNQLLIQTEDDRGVSSLKIHSRPMAKIGPFTPSTITTPTPNEYTYIIPLTSFDGIGIEYYFEATDRDNKTRSPQEGTYRVYTKDLAPTVPNSILSFGISEKNYRIISVPYESTEFFPQLGASDKKKFRAFKFKENIWSEYPDFTTLERGLGYFIIMHPSFSNAPLQLSERMAERNNPDNLYQMTLSPGWNLIGNPYPTTINWGDVLNWNENSSLHTELKVWGGEGSYSNVQELQGYQGAFVFLDGSVAATISIPFKGQQLNNGGRVKKEDYSFDHPQSWYIALELEQSDAQLAKGIFGMHPSAAVHFDRMDDLNPPALFNQVTLQFLHPEHSQKYFSRDIVPATDNYTWPFLISGLDGNYSLKWSINDVQQLEKDLFLYDEIDNRLVNMKTESHFRSDNKKLTVLYGENVEGLIKPRSLRVSSAFPNPSKNQNVNFTIAVPEMDKQNGEAMLQITNPSGMIVYQKRYPLIPGLQNITWENTGGHAELGGLFFYRINIGNEVVTGKVILENE